MTTPTLPQRLRTMADHTGLDAVAELLREAADALGQEAEPTNADLKLLDHCAIAVRDWLKGGCDVSDIPRPHISVLVTFACEVTALARAGETK